MAESAISLCPSSDELRRAQSSADARLPSACGFDALASRGWIGKSTNPLDAPLIQFNYMSSEQDWREFRSAVRITREIIHQQALDMYRGREISRA